MAYNKRRSNRRRSNRRKPMRNRWRRRSNGFKQGRKKTRYYTIDRGGIRM